VITSPGCRVGPVTVDSSMGRCGGQNTALFALYG
jgi:hypothetical protein